MDKLLTLFLIVLFTVGITTNTIFSDDGMQTDAVEMKDNTQAIISDANTQMETFANEMNQ